MGFPSLPATLDAGPDYPEVKLDFDLSLTRREEEILEGGGRGYSETGKILEEAAALEEQSKAEGLDDEARTSLIAQANALAATIPDAASRARQEWGDILAKAYCRKQYIVYGITLDFTSGPAALATLDHPDLPASFAEWLAVAPRLALQADAARKIKNCQALWPTQLAAKK